MAQGFEILIERIDKFVSTMDAEAIADRVGLGAMTELQGEYIERIFVKGQNTSGGEIGTYSKKSNYYTQSQFIRKGAFKPKGKHSSKDFTNGNKRKSMFLGGGYSELRKIQGRPNDKKDYNYSGSLKSGFSVLKSGSEVLFGQSSQFEVKKMNALTDRDGEVFTLGQPEKEFLKETISEGMVILYKGDD